MNVRYSLVAWEFNKELWGQVIAGAVEEFGMKEFAAMVGVDTSTLSSWAHIAKREGHKWPMMHNFMTVVNLLDLTPSDFFILEDK